MPAQPTAPTNLPPRASVSPAANSTPTGFGADTCRFGFATIATTYAGTWGNHQHKPYCQRPKEKLL